MDYLCAKFGNFSFSRFGFIVRTESQTESYTEADDRHTQATTVDACNDGDVFIIPTVIRLLSHPVKINTYRKLVTKSVSSL